MTPPTSGKGRRRCELEKCEQDRLKELIEAAKCVADGVRGGGVSLDEIRELIRCAFKLVTDSEEYRDMVGQLVDIFDFGSLCLCPGDGEDRCVPIGIGEDSERLRALRTVVEKLLEYGGASLALCLDSYVSGEGGASLALIPFLIHPNGRVEFFTGAMIPNPPYRRVVSCESVRSSGGRDVGYRVELVYGAGCRSLA